MRCWKEDEEDEEERGLPSPTSSNELAGDEGAEAGDGRRGSNGNEREFLFAILVLAGMAD